MFKMFREAKEAFRVHFGKWRLVSRLELIADDDASDPYEPPTNDQLAQLTIGSEVQLTITGRPKSRLYHWEHVLVRILDQCDSLFIGQVIEPPIDMPQFNEVAQIQFTLDDVTDIVMLAADTKSPPQ